MSKILIFAAGVVAGYALHNRRDQSIEKIADAAFEKSGKVWASATDYVRNVTDTNK